MKRFLTVSLLAAFSLSAMAQQEYEKVQAPDSLRIYHGDAHHEVKFYTEKNVSKTPKNIIFLIGDGMGTSQVSAGLTANKGQLFLENFKHVGFSQTQSTSDYVTDSAAGGTALACGERTYNGAIGVDANKKPIQSALEAADANGKATALVSTSCITHATPASFIAHQTNRNMYEEIAQDFLKTDIDVFIGGGYDHFAKRKDGKDLTTDLKAKGYQVLTDMKDISKVKSGKLAGLVAPVHTDVMPERGDMLVNATETALTIISQDKKGYFIMIEGSQIDWGGHANNTNYIVREMLDFDKVVGKALEFAAKDGETLVLVTADHETGGMALIGGDMKTGLVEGEYNTHDHSATMVPVFAFGPGADRFTGIMKNSDIGKILIELAGKK
ncbi:MAG: alkaline phosphatase [Mangrovibacterium sp.]